MIELFGDRTGNCLRVAVTLEEAGLPYRVRHVSLSAGAHRDPAFLALNPTGKVPTLVVGEDHGGIVLSQSLAIMLWAAGRSATPLMPELGSNAHAIAMERLFMVATDFVAPSQAAFILRLTGDRTGSQRLTQLVASRLDWLEHILSTAPYLAGDTFTLSDISAAAFIESLPGNGHWTARPHLSGWFARMSARGGYVRGMAAFNDV